MTKRKPKNQRKPKIQDPASNEQTPDAGGGGYVGESRGGFDPLMGWTTTAGAAAFAYTYAKTRPPFPIIKAPKNPHSQWDSMTKHALEAIDLENQIRKMNHPSSQRMIAKMNEEDPLASQIAKIRLTRLAGRARDRANYMDPDGLARKGRGKK